MNIILQIKAKIYPECKIDIGLFRFEGMRSATTLISILFVVGLLNCTQQSQADRTDDDNLQDSDTVISASDTIKSVVYHFSRDTIRQKLVTKSKRNELRVIHVFVPLCDNEFQGIVPVNSSLGDGTNLRTNLYWGAGYGIKTHFKRSAKWQTVGSTYDINKHVLERIVFKRADQNVIIVADAYRGDEMGQCVTDYFNTLAGIKSDTITLGDTSLVIGTTTDLVVFNGHNGLMDVTIDTVFNKDGVMKDAVAIACVSHSYFE